MKRSFLILSGVCSIVLILLVSSCDNTNNNEDANNTEISVTEPIHQDQDTGQITQITEEQDDTIRVNNVNDLFMAIKSDVIIKLEPGDYRLDRIDSNLFNHKCHWSMVLFDEIYDDEDWDDDKTLLIRHVKNLTIVGPDRYKSPARILTNRRSASVMAIDSCENIHMSNIIFGHDSVAYKDSIDPWVSNCSGEVLEFFDSKGIGISDCILFGCGTRGFLAHRCISVRVLDSEIKECSYGAFGVFGSENITISNCLIKDNQYRTLFEIEQTEDMTIKHAIIKNNKTADQYGGGPLILSESSNINFTNCQIFDNDFAEFDIIGQEHY